MNVFIGSGSLKSNKKNHKSRKIPFKKYQKIARFYWVLARENREEISIFLFSGFIYSLIIIYQINTPPKGEITPSMEDRVKLAVANFIGDFFLSYKTVAENLSAPSAANYVIPDAKLIYDSLVLQ